MVPIWNKLSEEAERARSVNAFKARYDEWVRLESEISQFIRQIDKSIYFSYSY